VLRELLAGNVKSIYACFLKNEESPPCIVKWSRIMDTPVDFKTVFRRLVKTTFDTRMRWFQWKILYRIIPTNRFLFQCKLSDSSLCSFCNQTEETISHLFWDCPIVQRIWFDLLNWMKSHFPHCDRMDLCQELVILGCKQNIVTDRVFDLCILLGKYSIFVSKIQGVTPKFKMFIRFIKNRYCDEKYMYANSNKAVKFFREWRMY